MIYNYINSKVIIGTVYDEFAIKSNDWENRAPQWIMKGLSYLRIAYALENVVEPIKFTNYKFKLPCNTKLLRAIIIDKKPLKRISDATYILSRHHNPNKYTYQLNAGYADVGVESGTATVLYNKPPFELDDKLNIWFPMIPDKAEVIDNLAWYVLTRILSRGYIHPVYNLTQNNGLTNPDMRWKTTLKTARNACASMDADKRAEMADIMTRFVSSSVIDTNELFADFQTTGYRVEPIHTFSDILKEMNNENS